MKINDNDRIDITIVSENGQVNEYKDIKGYVRDNDFLIIMTIDREINSNMTLHYKIKCIEGYTLKTFKNVKDKKRVECNNCGHIEPITQDEKGIPNFPPFKCPDCNGSRGQYW